MPFNSLHRDANSVFESNFFKEFFGTRGVDSFAFRTFSSLMGRAFPSAFLTNRSEEDLVGFANVGVSDEDDLEVALALDTAKLLSILGPRADVIVLCFKMDFV